MKFVAVLLFAFVAAAVAGPVSISDNNIGDIVTVGVKANLEVSNQIEQNIISVIVALLNQQVGVVRVPGDGPSAPNLPNLPKLSPELREKLRELLERLRERK